MEKIRLEEKSSEPKEKKPMSKEDFFANLETLTNIMRGSEEDKKETDTNQQ